MVRTIGIEEELLLIDPETRDVAEASPQVIKQFREHGPHGSEAASADLDEELFRHQLEVRTDPTREVSDALEQVRAARRTAGEAAAATGLAAVACGIVPRRQDHVVVTPKDRYRDMVDTFGEVARHGGTCGMHVHVGVASDEEGIAVIDRIAPWLPILLALSANSPFHEDRDTGYASWRSQVWTRWPTAGSSEQFGSVQAYREACDFMIAAGAARDAGMLYFDARLAREHPTVEMRVADVCTEPRDAILIAALVRGLVESSARSWQAGEPAARWRVDALRACHWRASKYAVADALVDPLTRRLRPAREVVETLVDEVRPALEEASDYDVVVAGVDRVLAHGGATAQRAAYERTGDVRGVVDDLVRRTRESWSE